jgi:hypothetical protein
VGWPPGQGAFSRDWNRRTPPFPSIGKTRAASSEPRENTHGFFQGLEECLTPRRKGRAEDAEANSVFAPAAFLGGFALKNSGAWKKGGGPSTGILVV